MLSRGLQNNQSIRLKLFNVNPIEFCPLAMNEICKILDVNFSTSYIVNHFVSISSLILPSIIISLISLSG